MKNQSGLKTLYISRSIYLILSCKKKLFQISVTLWDPPLRLDVQPFLSVKWEDTLFLILLVFVPVFLCIISEIRPVIQEVKSLHSVQLSNLENFYPLFSNPWRGFSLLVVSSLCCWTLPSWDALQDLRDQREKSMGMKESRDLRHQLGRMDPVAPAPSRELRQDVL